MIKKLWIKGYRNLEEKVLNIENFSSILIFGENNQGKTNFLEAIFFLINGKSPLENQIENIVSFYEKEAVIGGDFTTFSGENRLYCKLTKEGKKFSILNGKTLRTFSYLKHHVRAEFISSDIIRLFKDSPQFRRTELDQFCGLYFKEYGFLLKKYEKVIKQKNTLLKESPEVSKIRFWNEELIKLAKDIVIYRKQALEKINGVLDELRIDGNFELSPLKIEYVYINLKIEGPEQKYEEALREKCESEIQKEIAVGYSLYGPHRDDFIIKIEEKSLFLFCSRGINRLVAILLKLAQLLSLQKKEEAFPILLLDDAFAEIDSFIKEKVIQLMFNKQIFTVYASVLKQDKTFFKEPLILTIVQGKLSVCTG